MKKEQCVRHVYNCKYILRTLDCPIDSCSSALANLLKEKTVSKAWKPSSAKNYIASLQYLVKYLVNKDKTSEHGFNKAGLLTLMSSIKAWTKSIGKISSKEQRNQIRKRSAEDIVNPDDFGTYFTSDRYSEVNTLIKDLDKETIVSQASHTFIRNSLLLQTAISNANRTGCLTNVTVHEFLKGTKNIRNGAHVVLVEDHKTCRTHGDLELVFPSELFQKVQKYLSFVRPQSEAQQLFLLWSGKGMSRGAVADALSKELAHVGVAKKYVAVIVTVR